MYIEIIPDIYDCLGRKSYKPHLKKYFPPPTFPFGRYVSQPLTVQCHNLEELRRFLLGCKQRSDKETFGQDEYWLPPEEFEKLKQGDCDDFALWTWRQLMQMGYPARFVAGQYGRYDAGHCWTSFERDGKHYIADGTHSVLGKTLPRLLTLKYHPIYSVEWNGKSITFYSHQERSARLGFSRLLPFVFPWFWFSIRLSMRIIVRLPIFLVRLARRRLGRKHYH